MPRVCIVQPYVPAYRVRFFELLSEALGEMGVSLEVVASKPTGSQAERGDAVAPEWLTTVPSRQIRLAGRSLTMTTTRSIWRGAAAVIVPLMGSSLDAILATLTPKQKFGVWGHVAPYTSPPNAVDMAVERWQMRHANHVFAYTPHGADFAIRSGVEPKRVTAVMNTIDTSELSADIKSMDSAKLRDFRERLALPDGPYLAYIGGLDASKRIDLLVNSLDDLARRDSSVKVVVAGAGDQAALLKPAIDRGQVTHVGYLRGRDKAALLASSVAVCNPGRVGLVAVDAIVAKRPVITTDWPYHAPEIDYLVEGGSVFRSGDNSAQFAQLMETVVEQSGAPVEGQEFSWGDAPKLEDMVQKFARGVRAMLEV